MKKLYFYYIDTKYLEYLSKFQKHIWSNDYDGVLRPYIGIVFEINDFKYYAPLSSFRPNKYGRTFERIDLKIIKVRGRELAFLQLNNMIPVTTNLIELVKIDSHDKKYQDLLNAELADIRSRTDKILKDAKRVYNLTTKYRN